jgi:choline dehydrogenase-like flavoprotein
MSFDYIIAGTGSAACILAERLTRSGRHTVPLLEAGPRDSSPFIRMPRGFGRTLADPALCWHYRTEAEPARIPDFEIDPDVPVPQQTGGVNGILQLQLRWPSPADRPGDLA